MKSCHFTGYQRLRFVICCGPTGRFQASEVQQWKAFHTKDREGCEDLHSTVATALLLHRAEPQKNCDQRTGIQVFQNYRAQGFILNYVIRLKGVKAGSRELDDIPSPADEQI